MVNSFSEVVNPVGAFTAQCSTMLMVKVCIDVNAIISQEVILKFRHKWGLWLAFLEFMLLSPQARHSFLREFIWKSRVCSIS